MFQWFLWLDSTWLTFLFRTKFLACFLLCRASLFKMALHYRKKSEENICLEATYLESKPSFSYFFWMLQGSSLILFKDFNVFSWWCKENKMAQNDYLHMSAFELDLLKLFWHLPFKNDNWGNTIASCYLNPFQADVLFLYPLKS